MMRVQPVGHERVLVWLSSTTEEGEPFEWCVAHEDSEEAADATVAQMQRNHVPNFASAYRFERVTITSISERKPFVGTATPEGQSAEPEPAATQAPEVPW